MNFSSRVRSYWDYLHSYSLKRKFSQSDFPCVTAKYSSWESRGILIKVHRPIRVYYRNLFFLCIDGVFLKVSASCLNSCSSTSEVLRQNLLKPLKSLFPCVCFLSIVAVFEWVPRMSSWWDERPKPQKRAVSSYSPAVMAQRGLYHSSPSIDNINLSVSHSVSPGLVSQIIKAVSH